MTTSSRTSENPGWGAGPLPEPGRDCPRCPRLVAFRKAWRKREPTWFNSPVPSFGPRKARLLIVGLAPGLQGANRTGRPFTGDFAGDLLYQTLIDYGFARGHYAARCDDGLTLIDCRITNTVRCVPPENKPTGAEIGHCRDFLKSTIREMSQLRVIVALGRIAHDSVVVSAGIRLAAAAFAHGRSHPLDGLTLYDSYHCSRYNTNTGKLTPQMFHAVFAAVRAQLDAPSPSTEA
ncbi:MAG TPA: uracil-DNA glycosylase [Alphaproteobacteria bacterium]|nr:uracil-DNA glycosylase [Alphaproteobacteria bacterium]